MNEIKNESDQKHTESYYLPDNILPFPDSLTAKLSRGHLFPLPLKKNESQAREVAAAGRTIHETGPDDGCGLDAARIHRATDSGVRAYVMSPEKRRKRIHVEKRRAALGRRNLIETLCARLAP